jgi:ubiquinone/menaquinone biosynthesis C-methylase UbiE
MNITMRVKTFVQTIANRLGYEIYKLPPMVPLAHMRVLVGPFANAHSYQAVAEEFMNYFKNIGGLKPNESVLDVGCGCGQMAAALTGYLDKSAIYEGFDIVSTMIKWCERNISSKYPNFHFTRADIFNGSFNPSGRYTAATYKFPYKDQSFDFVFLKSVFTHMLPEDLENYLSEIARVMKSGGRCLISYFLLNTESLKSIESKSSTLDFKHVFGTYRTINEAAPEEAVAYNEEYVRNLYDKFGLHIIEPVYYGSWCSRRNFLSYQDIVIASRK